MIRKFLCFLGFHEYKKQLVMKIGKHKLNDRVCVYCGYNITWAETWDF